MVDNNSINSVRNRIRKLLADSGLSINRIAGGNGAVQRKLQRQINEDATLTLDTIMYLLEQFPDVSADWLLTGTPDDPKRSCPTETLPMVPVYAVEASANLNTLMTGEGNDLNEVLGKMHIPGIPRIDGATYIRGDSMYPILQSGDLIGFRILPVSYDSIFYGEMYLLSLDVEGDSYVTVKYLLPGEHGREYVTLKSANPNHPPKEIHLSTVRCLAQVKVIVHVTNA